MRTKVNPIPDEILIPAVNYVMDLIEVEKGERQCCDKWGEMEKCKVRELCGEQYRYVETDWIGLRAITLRKAGKLNAATNKRRKKWEEPTGWYKTYLESDHWQRFRKSVLIFWKFRCCVCTSTKKLDVHHNNYECIGKETITDCIAVCHRCHKRIHGGMRRIPENSPERGFDR